MARTGPVLPDLGTSMTEAAASSAEAVAEPLGADARRSFLERGFMAIPDMVSTAEVMRIKAILTSLHDDNVGYGEGAQYDALGLDDGSEPKKFPQIMHPRNFAPHLISGEFYRRAEAMARQLLGPDARLKADISLLKPARIGPPTPWHQDGAFQPAELDIHEISFWLALQPVDRDNSCMEFVPGSHLGPILEHGHPHNDPRMHALECVADFERRAAVPCPLPAGGCTLHTGQTLHCAGPNRSEAPRLAYVLIFDVLPTRHPHPRRFPWQDTWRPARQQRERDWRRRGGLLVHLWRQRSRLRLRPRHLLFDLRKAYRALRRM